MYTEKSRGIERERTREALTVVLRAPRTRAGTTLLREAREFAADIMIAFG